MGLTWLRCVLYSMQSQKKGKVKLPAGAGAVIEEELVAPGVAPKRPVPVVVVVAVA